LIELKEATILNKDKEIAELKMMISSNHKHINELSLNTINE